MSDTKPFVFKGSAVDPWLEGLTFQAVLNSDGKVVVTPTEDCAAEFKRYDTAMWTEWATRFAYGLMADTLKKARRAAKKQQPPNLEVTETPTEC